MYLACRYIQAYHIRKIFIVISPSRTFPQWISTSLQVWVWMRKPEILNMMISSHQSIFTSLHLLYSSLFSRYLCLSFTNTDKTIPIPITYFRSLLFISTDHANPPVGLFSLQQVSLPSLSPIPILQYQYQ